MEVLVDPEDPLFDVSGCCNYQSNARLLFDDSGTLLLACTMDQLTLLVLV
jgi:hypothetical protein